MDRTTASGDEFVGDAVLEPRLIDTLEEYFALLQGHAPAEEMLDEILTEDFVTGFVDGHLWRGPDGLKEFLAARSVFLSGTAPTGPEHCCGSRRSRSGCSASSSTSPEPGPAADGGGLTPGDEH
jgi:hypothetical protein